MVKECKLLREKKRRAKLLKSKRPMPTQRGVERRVILEKPPSSSVERKVLTVSVTRDSLVFAPDTLPVTDEQLPQAMDQDNPIPLGPHQLVNADTEQCLDLMLNNFQDVCQLMELQDLEPVSPVQVKGRPGMALNFSIWVLGPTCSAKLGSQAFFGGPKILVTLCEKKSMF